MLFEQDLIRFFKTRERILTREKRIKMQVGYCEKNLKPGEAELMPEQLEQIHQAWDKYAFAYKVNTQWHRMYTAKTGKFDPLYIPNELHYYFIENSKINYDYLRAFVDKNYYGLLFADVKQPQVVVRCIFGQYYDGSYNSISEARAVEITREKAAAGVVIKPSNNSWGGRNISFVHTDDMTEEAAKGLFESYGRNFIMQEVLRQHEALVAVHKDSINTIRIITIMVDGEVTVLSACLRMGCGKSRVDNFSQGGVGCGIQKDGRLNDVGYDRFGNMVPRHPDGFIFNQCVVPNFDTVVATVKRMALRVPMFGVVSWDFAINEVGEPVFIEYNVSQGGIDIHQYNNGPLYGELAGKIMDSVFDQYSVEDTHLAYNYSVFSDHVTIKTGSKERKWIRIRPSEHELPVTQIGKSAFEKGSIKRIHLPASIKHLDYCAFCYCRDLKHINLPEGLETIDRSVFNGCKALRKIVIPSSVRSIGIRAFKDIGQLDVYIKGSTIEIAEDAFEGSQPVIHGLPGSDAEKYAKAKKLKFISMGR